MKFKLFLTLLLAIAVSTAYAADNVIVLKANDGQVVKIEPELAQQSETLKEMYQSGLLQKDKAGNAVFESTSFDVKQLRLLYELLRFALQHPIEFPVNPTLQDHQTYQEKIEQIAELFKQRYPDKLQYPKIFEVAEFFDIPSVMQAIGQLLISPELNLKMLQEHKYSWFNKFYTASLQDVIARQLKRRIDLAKEKHFMIIFDNQSPPSLYLRKLAIKDDYFTGVSIQDMLDHQRFPAIRNLELDLNGRYINSLEGIENVRNIEQIQLLDLSYNILTNDSLSSLPALPNLEEIRLGFNRLDDIPQLDAERFRKLKDFSLRFNMIKTIPENMTMFSHLNALDLSHNNIQVLPTRVVGLSNLEILDLSFNRIKSIPAYIQGFDSLRYLDLSKNVIEDVPEKITGLRRFMKMDLRGNPVIKTPSFDIFYKNSFFLDIIKDR